MNETTQRRTRTHLLSRLFELIVPALLGVEVSERGVLEYLPALRAFDALHKTIL
jgi:hypothetical protein